jgi:selenophosphate synthetase-related protein
MEDLKRIAELVRNFPGLTRKREIHLVQKALGRLAPRGLLDEDGVLARHGQEFIVAACDAIIPRLCESDPYFAGKSAVLASVNDVAAMGGRPVLIVNSIGAPDGKSLKKLVRGMADAASLFGLPIAGGHLLPLGGAAGVTVTVVGLAKRPLLSSTLKTGHRLIVVADPLGRRPRSWRFGWDSTGNTRRRIRGHYSVLRKLAEQGLLTAGKDISNPGLLGTLALLLETSRKGGVIELSAIRHPSAMPGQDWYRAFFSFGFVLGARKKDVAEVLGRLRGRGLWADVAGRVTRDTKVILSRGGEQALLFDWKRDCFLKNNHRASKKRDDFRT